MSLALACPAMLVVPGSTMLMLEATCMNDRYEGLLGMPRFPRIRNTCSKL